MAQQADYLDRAVVFLAKREGIDKTLKIIRYTTKLLLAYSANGTELHKRLSSLDSSIGISRKAYRLGKFLQDVNSIRKANTRSNLFYLELLAYGGEGVYYFIEQFVWLMKAGLLPKTIEPHLVVISAWAELVGYVGGVALNVGRVRGLLKQEAMLMAKLDKMRKEEGVLDSMLSKELAKLQYQRYMRLAFIVQDLADATIALNDVTTYKAGFIGRPAAVAIAGLISAFVSSYKNWTS